MRPGTPPLQSIRLLDQVLERIRYLHYSLKTEKAYLHWVRFFYSLERNAAWRHAAPARHGQNGNRSVFFNDGK